MRMSYFFFLLLIKKIICECYYRCIECQEDATPDFLNHYCKTCINNTYLLVNSKNCYYTYELPNYYLDSSTNKFQSCSSTNNCYECLDSSTTCKSCKRGYEYNENLNNCEICNSDNYIYVLDDVENCQGGESGISKCKKKITKCADISTNTENYECPRNYPLFRITDDSFYNCAMEIYEPGNHTISNQIIEKQWLNKITKIGEDDCVYLSADYSSQEVLIIETNIFDTKNNNIDLNRFFYGIKSNGRLFFNNDDDFCEQKTIIVETTYHKYKSQLKKINLVNDEKYYYLTFDSLTIETIDFENNEIVGFSQEILFGNYNWSSKIITILELNNEKNVYLFSIIAKNEETHYLNFYKYKFYKSNLLEDNSFENIKSIINNPEYSVSPSRIISCIEISSFNIIQCLYIDINKYYVISLFDESSLNIIITKIIDDISIIYEDSIDYDYYYYECILFKNEITIIAYILDPNSDLIYIQFKEIKYQNEQYILEDYLLLHKKIIINSKKKYNFSSYCFISQLKKINNNRFCLITTSKNRFESYIILFDFYNYRDTSLFIRYYHIPLKLYDLRIYRYVLSINFNGFLGVVYTNLKITWGAPTQHFLIFSYINSIDSVLNTLEQGTILILNHYINEQNIENNIFGVIFYGIKILKVPRNIGIHYLSQKHNTIVHENDILEPDDSIIFVYDYDNLVRDSSVYTIEMAGVVQEPTYEEFNKYPEDLEYYGSKSQEIFYFQRVLTGKTSFYNFTISLTLNGDNDGSCKSYCKVCYNNFCIKCLDNYILKEDTDSCLLETSIDGYYFDPNSFTFRKCYESCKTCSGGPIFYNERLDVEDSNCEICNPNYYKVINTNNCLYKDASPIAYYLDLNLGLFANCYENCMTCNQNKINFTYFNCLSCDDNNILYEKSKNCLNCSYFDKLVNYYQYKCIDIIPEGYYLLDEELKTIDKCYITCKHCNIKGNSNDHKCIECADAYPYNFNNGEKCLDDCSKENLYMETSTNKCYNDCSNNNLNDKTSNYKNKCISKNEEPKNYILDEYNNFVSKCDPKKEYEFNNECYSSCPDGTELDKSVTNKNQCICKNLYYLNGEDYICINDKICPTDYPYLNIGTSICSKCPVKYKGKCYSECPVGTCITMINSNLANCVDKIDDIKELGELCFEDFIRIFDFFHDITNNNIVINENQGVSINIYTTELNLYEAENIHENLTFINLGECENKLREYYKLNPNQKIFIISVDVLTKLSNKSTNDFDYEIY